MRSLAEMKQTDRTGFERLQDASHARTRSYSDGVDRDVPSPLSGGKFPGCPSRLRTRMLTDMR